MRAIFKFLIIFLCLWVGTKSILSLSNPSVGKFDAFIDITLFVIFVGSPAATYWGNAIDKAFNQNDDEENDNYENNN